jgi:hypothetical protein
VLRHTRQGLFPRRCANLRLHLGVPTALAYRALVSVALTFNCSA